MHLRKTSWTILLTIACVMVWGVALQESHADSRVKRATAYYLKGNRLLKARKYSAAVRAFRRAYRTLPRHPHFNCHRSQFLNYMGNAQERMRKPYSAMRSYYKSAYRSRCKTAATRNYAARRYKSLYRRWSSSITITTTPPKARLILLGKGGDKTIGRTPFKRVFSPGRYRFKIRLYDHRTVFVNLTLRPGSHIKREYKLVKGDDPVNRPEKVDVAPPPPVLGAKSNAPNAPNAKKKKAIALLGRRVSNSEVRGLDSSSDISKITGKPSRSSKIGPPVYKQVWFWAVIGTVAAAAVIIPIAVPKEQKILINQGKLF